jgi:mannosylglycoprotein endo-beta-mannosidase
MTSRVFILAAALISTVLFSRTSFSQMSAQTLSGWQMQDSAKVIATAADVSSFAFHPQGWYSATVPGTALTTLVNNHVYPEPLYGENMRAIPEGLNKISCGIGLHSMCQAATKDGMCGFISLA